jgi:hypothetical protein
LNYNEDAATHKDVGNGVLPPLLSVTETPDDDVFSTGSNAGNNLPMNGAENLAAPPSEGLHSAHIISS